MIFSKKDKGPNVKFVSTVKGLEQIKECVPRPSSNFIPEWWKNTPVDNFMPSLNPERAENVKHCPSFADYFSQGFVMPMWCDTILYYDSDINQWSWRTSSNEFQWSIHSQEQYIDFANHKHLGKKAYMVFKSISPWKVITSPGYSMYQLPMFFEFNEDFVALPGIRDSDRYHDINTQLILLSDKKEIFIPRGTPIAQYIPFKRTKYNLSVTGLTPDVSPIIDKHEANIKSRFGGQRHYVRDRKK